MGRIHFRHPNGKSNYICKNCKLPLADKKWLLSTKFTGSSGRAVLIEKAVNIRYG